MKNYTYQVLENQTAKHLGSGDLNVLGTPGLIAMVENACMQQAGLSISGEDTTVGVHIAMNHVAKSFVGAEITVSLINQRGSEKSFEFEFEAHDNGVLVGQGSHKRVKVNKELFMKK